MNESRSSTYRSTIHRLKLEAESAAGVQFGPPGSNGDLSAKACGTVGGMITKAVFDSLASQSISDLPHVREGAITHPHTITH